MRASPSTEKWPTPGLSVPIFLGALERWFCQPRHLWCLGMQQSPANFPPSLCLGTLCNWGACSIHEHYWRSMCGHSLLASHFRAPSILLNLHQRSISREAWRLLPNVSQWVLQIVKKGYRIQFGFCPPHFNGVLSTVVSYEQTQVLEQEVYSFLAKEAIECVPLPERDSGFYSRYFVVPKGCIRSWISAI